MQLSEMQAYVRDRLSISSGDTAKTTQITTALNQARYRLNAKHRLKKTTAALDFTADTATVTMPSDVVEILSIYQGDYLMQPVNEQDFAEVAGSSATGGPQVYLIDGSSATMRVSPLPSVTAVGAATLSYVQRPTALSGASDVPSEVPAEFHDLIAEMAIYRIAMSEEDFDLARGAVAVAAELDEELMAYMNRRRGPTTSRQVLRGYTR